MHKINISRLIHRGLLLTFGGFFAVAVTAQVLLLSPHFGGSLPASGVAEYESVGSPSGCVIIELKPGYKPSGNIKILVNGIEAAALSSQSVCLTVMNNSVIELDGRRVSYPFEAVVASQEDKTVCEGDYSAVDGNIAYLTRVFVNVDNIP